MQKKSKVWLAVAFLMLLWPVAGVSAPVEDLVQTWRVEWKKTDFSRFSVELSEIISGGPPRDGIPPIDRPRFDATTEAERWLGADEPVLVFSHQGDVRAYPLQVLIWHEIVNDTVGGKPVVITFCPLCNSALVFERTVAGRVLDFGTTGKLRKSDLVMWDRQTESWWQQMTGEGIVGEYTATNLTYLPGPLVSFRTYRSSYPGGKVLSRETGHFRDYGANPYVGYDTSGNSPFLLTEPVSGRLPAMERVVALELEGKPRAYPYGELEKAGGVAHDTLAGRELTIWFQKGTRSALDRSRIRASRDVGAAVVFSRRLGKNLLTFSRQGGKWKDRETGSSWNLLGQALDGPLRGKKLTTVPHGNHFAFAWLAFRPKTEIWKAP